METSLVVHWLRLHTSTIGVMDSIPGGGTKILCVPLPPKIIVKVYNEDASTYRIDIPFFCLFLPGSLSIKKKKSSLLVCTRLAVRVDWRICAEYSLAFSRRLERLNVVLCTVARVEKGLGVGLTVS